MTDGFYDSLNPSFDANGEYLYFLSYRDFTARMDIFEDNHVILNPVQVMAVQLKAGQAPPFAKGAPRTAEAQPFRIDVAGLEQRVFPLPVKAGNYFFLKAGKGAVTWASTDFFGESEYETVFKPSGEDKWTLHVFDMGAQKLTTVGRHGQRLEALAESRAGDREEGQRLLRQRRRQGGRRRRRSGTQLNLDQMAYRVSPVAEWTQIFNDTWRWYRDFFYDANMHGNDWKKIGDKFRAMLPALNNRADLNWLLSQMVGELSVSHTYVSGGDFSPMSTPQTPVFTGLLGADLAADPSGYPRLARILGPTAYNRDLVGAARPPRLRRQGRRLPDRHRRPRPQGRQPLPPPAGHPRPEGRRHRQPHAVRSGREDVRGRADPLGERPPLQPLDRRQHRRRPEGLERRPRLHAHHRDELQQHRPVRQVLAGVPRPEGPRHRRARQRRRVDGVLHHRQARAEDGGAQRRCAAWCRSATRAPSRPGRSRC